MRRRVITPVIILGIVILLVSGCSKFFGTISGRMEAQRQAIEYIHHKYKVPVEHLNANIPSYRHEVLGYLTKVNDANTHLTYLLTVRFPSNKDGVDIEEFPHNPIIE